MDTIYKSSPSLDRQLCKITKVTTKLFDVFTPTFFQKEPKLMHARGHLGKGNHWKRQGMWGRDKEIQEPSLVTRGTTKMHFMGIFVRKWV